jgi:hypothetical protein
MKFSISIMMHPSRMDFLPYLFDRLGPCPVSIDAGIGIWENCKAAWRFNNPEAEYHIVIQDDAIICDNFLELAERAIITGKLKNCVTSLFFGKRMLLMDVGKQGLKRGFVTKNMLHWGLAVCLPVKLIEPMIAFGDKLNIPQDDARISLFLQSRKIGVYYPLPSLVDHRIGKSLVNDPGEFRTAYKYIDENK